MITIRNPKNRTEASASIEPFFIRSLTDENRKYGNPLSEDALVYLGGVLARMKPNRSDKSFGERFLEATSKANKKTSLALELANELLGTLAIKRESLQKSDPILLSYLKTLCTSAYLNSIGTVGVARGYRHILIELSSMTDLAIEIVSECLRNRNEIRQPLIDCPG
jgi:hypothetical protein